MIGTDPEMRKPILLIGGYIIREAVENASAKATP